MDIKVVIALNMHDELLAKGDTFDYEALGKMIGIPIIPTIGTKAIGISDLFQKVIDVFEDKEPTVRHIHINYGSSIEESIKAIQEKIKIKENFSTRTLIFGLSGSISHPISTCNWIYVFNE